MSRKYVLAVLILFPMVAYAKPEPKQKESIIVEVASIKTNTHSSYARTTSWVRSRMPSDSFSYTDVIFAIVDGKHVVYSCAERNKVCPVLEAGSKVPAERDGDSIYITSTVPSEKKPLVTHYKFASNGW